MLKSRPQPRLAALSRSVALAKLGENRGERKVFDGSVMQFSGQSRQISRAHKCFFFMAG